MNLKSFFLLGVAGAILLSGCTLPLLLYARAEESYRADLRGPEQTFIIEPKPASLTEELAIEKATETFARDGFNPSEWLVSSVYKSKSDATIRFTGGGRFRLYAVRLTDTSLTCYSVQGTQRDFESWETRPKLNPTRLHGKDKTR